MRLIVSPDTRPAVPKKPPVKPETTDPCRCDDDKIDWRKILKGI